jgi:bifunctional non-homologous end joining protein LigD
VFGQDRLKVTAGRHNIQAKARFIEPMLLLRTARVPEGANWQYECKLDGYRAIAVKSGGRVQLRSRNNKDFNGKYPAIVKAPSSMPDETVIDGEIVALDESGQPSFNVLQNYDSSNAPLVFYAFDALIVAGRDLIPEPLEHRREILQASVLPHLTEPIRESPILDVSLPDLIRSVKASGARGHRRKAPR